MAQDSTPLSTLSALNAACSGTDQEPWESGPPMRVIMYLGNQKNQKKALFFFFFRLSFIIKPWFVDSWTKRCWPERVNCIVDHAVKISRTSSLGLQTVSKTKLVQVCFPSRCGKTSLRNVKVHSSSNCVHRAGEIVRPNQSIDVFLTKQRFLKKNDNQTNFFTKPWQKHNQRCWTGNQRHIASPQKIHTFQSKDSW